MRRFGALALLAVIALAGNCAPPTAQVELARAPLAHKGGVGWPSAPVAQLPGIDAMGSVSVHNWNYLDRAIDALPEGIEYVAYQWGCGTSGSSWDTVSLSSIERFAAKYPGLKWLIFNEPDRQDQADCLPSIAADTYNDIYNILKTTDPTSKVYCCGTSNYQAHWKWMGAFLEVYSDKYGSLPPMDGLHYHFYNDFVNRFNVAQFQDAVLRTKHLNETWMNNWAPTMSQLPWIISEWGVLSDYGDSPTEAARVAEFLRATWGWLGRQPYIEQHFWYATYVDELAGNLLVERNSSTLSVVGQAFQDMAFGSPAPTPTPTATPAPVPTTTPTVVPTATPEPAHVYCDCVCVTVTPTP